MLMRTSDYPINDGAPWSNEANEALTGMYMMTPQPSYGELGRCEKAVYARVMRLRLPAQRADSGKVKPCMNHDECGRIILSTGPGHRQERYGDGVRMKNVIPIRRPAADSEVTEIAIGEYTVRRRVFDEGSSYLTVIDEAGAVLFVSKDVQDVCLPILIAAFAAGRKRGRNDMLVEDAR